MRVLVVMDAIEGVLWDKDTTFGFMLSAQARGHELFYCQIADLAVAPDGIAQARAAPVSVRAQATDFYQLGEARSHSLRDFHTVWMRKDPPVDDAYLHASLVLDFAPPGTLVVNRPQSLRDANEKLYSLKFREFVPPTLVTRRQRDVRAFVEQHGPTIVKPLDGHGGSGVFFLAAGDRNIPSIVETATADGRRWVIAQRYIPEARQGDKRIILLDGEFVGAILRVPPVDDHRGNIHIGGRVVVTELTDRERAICAAVGERARADGLYFVGLDVIGDYLTEVNVTSPTGIREVHALGGPNIGDLYVEWCEKAVLA